MSICKLPITATFSTEQPSKAVRSASHSMSANSNSTRADRNGDSMLGSDLTRVQYQNNTLSTMATYYDHSFTAASQPAYQS